MLCNTHLHMEQPSLYNNYRHPCAFVLCMVKLIFLNRRMAFQAMAQRVFSVYKALLATVQRAHRRSAFLDAVGMLYMNSFFCIAYSVGRPMGRNSRVISKTILSSDSFSKFASIHIRVQAIVIINDPLHIKIMISFQIEVFIWTTWIVFVQYFSCN